MQKKNPPTKIKDKDLMVEKIELEKRIVELEQKWKRALADYQNLEKKMTEEKKDWFNWAKGELLLKLLPVLNNLEKAADHLKDKGLDLSLAQLRKILDEEGLESIEIEPGKTKFDVQLMECVETQTGKEDVVLKVIEKGYKLKGKLLKPAKVVVGKNKI